MDYRFNKEVSIHSGNTMVQGELIIPPDARAVVIFSHGSGSSRFSTRNQMVAKYLHKKNMGTLLFDLLTPAEDRIFSNRFDIDLLTRRLTNATAWLKGFPAAANCSIGYFGASTGAASALKAAAVGTNIAAVVSRGGRPDLALQSLKDVTAPTMLIVGSRDDEVLRLNKEAYQFLKCKKKLEVVEGATHLFEEPGKMEIVCALAAGWFEQHMMAVRV